VEVFERAPACAGTVESWQHVRLFSDWSLNMGEAGRVALASHGQLPAEGDFPTGREFVDSYLMPLASSLKEHPNCRGVHFGTEVLAVGRGSLLKGESINGGDLKMPKDNPHCKSQRASTPFRLLVREGETERYASGFDVVVDCSGSYGRRELGNWVGNGGVPAIGERSLRQNGRIWATVPDVLGADRARFAGRRTLVVGAGYSAATTVSFLLELVGSETGTSVAWATRRGGEPYEVLEEDPLPARKRLCQLGNQVVSGALQGVDYIRGAVVSALAPSSNGRLRVELEVHGRQKPQVEEVDELVACVGYRPDSSLHQELQVHQCYATDGPIKLAATLLGASGDCLKQSAAGVETLKNPEPGFFILGSKSYGRSSAFLLKIGYSQAKEVLDAVAPPVAAPAS